MKQTNVIAVLLLVLVACTPTGPTTLAGPKPHHPKIELGMELAEVPADPREGILGVLLGHILSEEHLRQQPLDNAVSKKAFKEYLENLDPGKLFLLQEHATALSAYAEYMDDEMRDGDLELARKGAALLIHRQKVVEKTVASLLTKPFDFGATEEIETDPEKLAFVGTETELTDRWRKMLKLQILQRVAQMEDTAAALAKAKAEGKEAPADEIPADFDGKEKKAREDMAASYEARFKRLTDIDALEPAETFLNAVAAIYDPHTLYMAPAEKENFDIQMSGSLEGIGAVLAEDGHYIVVQELVPGGASARQGKLAAGDTILAVAQKGDKPVDVADMPIQKVVKMIRGPKGTMVSLTIKKPGGAIETIAITRDVVEIEAAYARGAILDLGPNHEPMGYVLLPSFYGNMRSKPGATGGRNATDDVRALLQDLEKQKVGGMILDLRSNAGGLLDHARDISGLFIETGPVVQTRQSDGKIHVLEDEDQSVSFRGDVVVLVDRFSASAAEILAGALQDYDRALLVGTGPTHGKGTVQVVVDLDQLRRMPGPPLGVLKLTVQQYFRVDGRAVQWRGVVPDILLPDPAAHIEAGERSLHHTIPWSKVQPLEHKDWAHTWDANALRTKSQERRKSVPVFAKIDARSTLLKAREKDTKMPLQREAWVEKRKQDKEALDAVDPKLDEGNARFEVTLLGHVQPKAPDAKDGDKSKGSTADKWQTELSHDPWIEEALRILSDMQP